MSAKQEFIKDLISKMSLEQKVGQCLTLGFNGTVPSPKVLEAISKFHCGGLRVTPNGRSFGSYIDPHTGKTIVEITKGKIFLKNDNAPQVNVNDFKNILADLQKRAKERDLGIPLHFSYDQEGNCGNLPFREIKTFPEPMGLKASGDIKNAYRVANWQAKQSRAIGYHFCHSPVVDINVNPDNPEVNTRAYSDDAQEVADWALEACRGYKDAGIVATAKHFPGRGDSNVDAHYSVPVINVDKETFYARELLPYRTLIEAGVLPSIMLAHSYYPAIDEEHISTVSHKIITGVLRKDLKFNGVITTDSMTMGGIASKYGIAEACALSLEAGADLILMKAQNDMIDDTFNAIMAHVEAGTLTELMLEEKCTRILSLKYDYGLFEEDPVIGDINKICEDDELIKLQKEIARKSTALVRNRKDIVPLSRNEKVLVIEQAAANANNHFEHNGILFENIMKFTNDVSYVEIANTADEQDKQLISEVIKDYDTIIMTHFFNRREAQNNELIASIIAKGKDVILVPNTPYKLSIIDEVDTAVLSYGYSYTSMYEVARIIFGQSIGDAVKAVSNGVV